MIEFFAIFSLLNFSVLCLICVCLCFLIRFLLGVFNDK